jgi:hypothetical protein
MATRWWPSNALLLLQYHNLIAELLPSRRPHAIEIRPKILGLTGKLIYQNYEIC